MNAKTILHDIANELQKVVLLHQRLKKEIEKMDKTNFKIILIVEDDEDILDTAKEQLVDKYHLVLKAISFEQAKMIEESVSHIDLVICDLYMPGMAPEFPHVRYFKENYKTAIFTGGGVIPEDLKALKVFRKPDCMYNLRELVDEYIG